MFDSPAGMANFIGWDSGGQWEVLIGQKWNATFFTTHIVLFDSVPFCPVWFCFVLYNVAFHIVPLCFVSIHSVSSRLCIARIARVRFLHLGSAPRDQARKPPGDDSTAHWYCKGDPLDEGICPLFQLPANVSTALEK